MYACTFSFRATNCSRPRHSHVHIFGHGAPLRNIIPCVYVLVAVSLSMQVDAVPQWASGELNVQLYSDDTRAAATLHVAFRGARFLQYVHSLCCMPLRGRRSSVHRSPRPHRVHVVNMREASSGFLYGGACMVLGLSEHMCGCGSRVVSERSCAIHVDVLLWSVCGGKGRVGVVRR